MNIRMNIRLGRRSSSVSPRVTVRMTRAWAGLGAVAVVALGLLVALVRTGERPLIDRHDCLDDPSSYTRALDRSQRGDALYRFVYDTLFGLGTYPPRPGFPHVDMAPACTVGWKDPVAAIKIGPRIYVVRFEGRHVASVKGAD